MKKKALIQKAVRLQAKIEKSNKLRQELEDVIESLVALDVSTAKVGKSRIEIVDQFETKNKKWKSVAFSRYTLKVEAL